MIQLWSSLPEATREYILIVAQGHPNTAIERRQINERFHTLPEGQVEPVSSCNAGLPEELSIHSARHTLAVHLLRKTGNLRQVQKQLGHASPAVTANMYADISFEDMQSGLDRLYDNGGAV